MTMARTLCYSMFCCFPSCSSVSGLSCHAKKVGFDAFFVGTVVVLLTVGGGTVGSL